ncbi:cytochrome b [Bradyrhizobium sp.]|uniref:cytochrome b n=1 Tax=Bradyrhizobium sp. TaxID=376 RepID=UPI003C4D299A
MIVLRHRFNPLQRGLHWLMAICIIAMLFIGVTMVSIVAPTYLPLITTHETLGTVIFVLVCIRLVLRLYFGAPPLPVDLPTPIKMVATLSQYALYGLMIVMPLLGWAMLSAERYPVMLYWKSVLPQVLPQSESAHTWLWRAHHYLAFAFFALILMHVAAALFHALVRRDGVFQSMAPWPAGDEVLGEKSDGA